MAKLNKADEKWVGNSGMKRLPVDLDPELHAQLKRCAVDEGVNMVEIVRKLIKRYVSR